MRRRFSGVAWQGAEGPARRAKRALDLDREHAAKRPCDSVGRWWGWVGGSVGGGWARLRAGRHPHTTWLLASVASRGTPMREAPRQRHRVEVGRRPTWSERSEPRAAKPSGGVGAPVCEGRACAHRAVWRHHPARSRSDRKQFRSKAGLLRSSCGTVSSDGAVTKVTFKSTRSGAIAP